MAVKPVKFGAIEYLQAENIPVRHCFTTRIGGVGQGAAKGLNIGAHRDDFQRVEENYALLGQALNFDPRCLVLGQQVHGNTVRAVTASDAHGLDHLDYPACDGLITNEPGVGLVVFTADCTPVLLWDSQTGAVGAVHAGWKGTALDICAEAVKAMAETYGCKPENIHAAIGPNIAQCCFETDADVPQALLETYGNAVSDHIRQQGNKYYVNLKAINAYALSRAGVRDIAISHHCTACDPVHFWSHRKMGNQRGSQGAIIICQEG
jgi:YfiH family protein